VVAARMDPKEAAAVCGQVAAILSQAISRKYQVGEYDPSVQLAQGLSALAAHMEPKEAAAVCRQAASTLLTNWSSWSWQALSQSSGWPPWGKEQQPVQVLSALAARMEPKEAAALWHQAAAVLGQAMKIADHYALGPLAKSLLVVAAHMEPKEASALCGQVVALLVQAFITKTEDWQSLQALVPWLSAAAEYLEPKEAGEAAAIISEAIANTPGQYTLRPLAEGLSAVAARMESKQAAAVCGRAASAFSQTMIKREIHSDEVQVLARGLSAVVARMEPKEAAASLIQAMTRIHPYSYSAFGPLGRSLSAVAAHMEAKEAAAVCGQAAVILSQALAKTTVPQPQMAEGLSAVAIHIEAKQAREAAATLIQAITKGASPIVWPQLARGLSAVAARMEAKEAASVCGQAAATLCHAMTSDPRALPLLGDGLSAVAAWMEPKEAAAVCGQAAASLMQAMDKTMDSAKLLELARGLSAVATRMEAKDAAKVCGQTAAILSRATTRTTPIARNEQTGERVGLPQLVQALSAVATRMEANEAGDTAANLCQAMAKTTDPLASQQIAWALTAVLLREDSSPNGSPRQSLVGVVGALTPAGGLLLAPALLRPALEPPPPPLPAQTLVELLKQPFCVGEARQQVLGQLARHYHRPFADQWEFVRFVKEQPSGLDLRSPPQRPGRDSTNQEP